MRRCFLKVLLGFLLSFLTIAPTFANDFSIDDPFYALKQEISERTQIYSFETKTISAKYPTENISKSSIHFPGYRGPGQLVIYYPDFDDTTGTNEYGMEAVVENGVVVKLTGADSAIPKNGYIVSGHGSSKNWIKNNLKIGTNVIIEKNTIIAYTTPDSFVYRAKEQIKEAESFARNAKKSSKTNDDKKATTYLKKAKSDLKKAQKAREENKKRYAQSSMHASNLAIKYALPYIEEEFKGVWLRPSETNIFEIRKTLDKIKKTGINEIFLETYFHGYTIFPSKVMAKYGLTPQNPKFLMFDPLEIYIKEAHKRDLKVHCWFESFYIGNKKPSSDYNSILSKYPSWGNKNLANYNSKEPVAHKTEHNGYFLDPANEAVVEFLIELISEITTNYKIDGINLDYTRYPTAQKSDLPNFENSHWGYTEVARKEFIELYNVDPIEIKGDSSLWKKWSEYRQDKLFNYLKKAREVVSKDIFLTAVIFPDYEICLDTKNQDWAKWSKEELIDGMTPLIMTSDNELFETILKEVKQKSSNKTQILTGLFVGFMDGEPEELLRQISVSRALKTKGIILFDWAHLPYKYQDALQYRVFLPKK